MFTKKIYGISAIRKKKKKKKKIFADISIPKKILPLLSFYINVVEEIDQL